MQRSRTGKLPGDLDEQPEKKVVHKDLIVLAFLARHRIDGEVEVLLEAGKMGDEEPAEIPNGVENLPSDFLPFVLAVHLHDRKESVQRAEEPRIGKRAVEFIEHAGYADAVFHNGMFLDFLHQAGLADSGFSGEENDPSVTFGRFSVKVGERSVFPVPADQPEDVFLHPRLQTVPRNERQ